MSFLILVFRRLDFSQRWASPGLQRTLSSDVRRKDRDQNEQVGQRLPAVNVQREPSGPQMYRGKKKPSNTAVSISLSDL